jgi:UDP-3-O-[3-hydroxymyristoyl] N-acetylglucosamine deacetylase
MNQVTFMSDMTLAAIRQKTLKTRINCSGVGLHTGRRVTLTIGPAAIDTGIRFKRIDPAGMGAVIAARWDNVVDTRLCTVIGNRDGVVISTVEHMLAAFSGLGIDNAMVEIDGPELPIMDGSADAFVFLIECAGIVEQSAARKRIRILHPISVGDDRASATLTPGLFPTLDFTLDFANPAIGKQQKSIDMTEDSFKRDLSRARTFGFAEEVEMLRKAGLARGGSLDNAIVIGADRVLNSEGLRYGDEFVRHKMLDAMGDLYLAGAVIEGHFRGFRSGHALNNQLLRALFADQDAWAWADAAPLSGWAKASLQEAA